MVDRGTAAIGSYEPLVRDLRDDVNAALASAKAAPGIELRKEHAEYLAPYPIENGDSHIS